MSESDIVNAVGTYLTYKGIFWYRQNTGATRTATGGFLRFGIKGAPDIVAVKDGRYIGIECKSEKGIQSPDQKAFQLALELAGGRYILARSIDDLQTLYA